MVEDIKYSDLLESLRDDLQEIKSKMQVFSTKVIDNKISRWPLYVAFSGDCNLGKPAFLSHEMGLNLNYNASLLEEFIERGLIKEEKVPEFKKQMGNPKEKATIFILTPEIAKFVFVDFDDLD